MSRFGVMKIINSKNEHSSSGPRLSLDKKQALRYSELLTMLWVDFLHLPPWKLSVV
jgi:hypothetical protein